MENKKAKAQEVAEQVWKIIEDSAAYSFNASHSLAYAGDAAYALICKASHILPKDDQKRKRCLGYFIKALESNSDSKEQTKELLEELPSFNISIKNPHYGKCSTNYIGDYENDIIYRSLNSIAGIGDNTAKSLIRASEEEKFETFSEFLIRVKTDAEFKLNQSQIKNLILVDFFSPFGIIPDLLEIRDKFFNEKEYKYECGSKKPDVIVATLQKKKDLLISLEKELKTMNRKDFTPLMKIRYQLEILGTSYDKCEEYENHFIVTDVVGKAKKTIICYNVSNGEVEQFKYTTAAFKDRPIDKFQLIVPVQVQIAPKSFISGYNINGKPIWEKSKDIMESTLLRFNRTEIDEKTCLQNLTDVI